MKFYDNIFSYVIKLTKSSTKKSILCNDYLKIPSTGTGTFFLHIASFRVPEFGSKVFLYTLNPEADLQKPADMQWTLITVPEAKAEGTLCGTRACKAERSAHRPEVEFTVGPMPVSRPWVFPRFFRPRVSFP